MLATNVEFWSAVVLDFADVPPELFTPMFSSARVAGWSAHIMEQKREGRLIRPSAPYVGPGPRSADLGQRRRAGDRRHSRSVDDAAARGRSGSSWSPRSSARPWSRSTRTVVNVALPAIADDLGGGLAGQQWTSNAYLVTLSSLLLIGGSLGDLFGERRMFVVGVAGFGVTSLLCALAPTIEMLVVARALQGVSARS